MAHRVRRPALKLPVAVAVASALALPVAFRPIFDGDAGWHLAVGRLIAQGRFPRTNALAWTAADEPWYPTSWLFDRVAFQLDAALGPLGLQLLVAALVLVALIGWAFALRSADPELGVWLLPAGALLLVPRITHRPHVATWGALAIVTALGLAGRGGSARHRWAMAPVIALFGNLHAGAGFAAGVAGFFCLEELVRTRRKQEILAAAACGLALLANPGAIFNVGYLFDHLRVQSVVSLVEFLPATFARLPLLWILTPLALLAGLLTRGRIGWALTASFAVLAALGFRSNRVGTDAFVCALPLLAAGLAALRPGLGPRAPALLTVLAMLGVALAIQFGQWLPPVFSASWNEERLPVRAAAFAKAAGLAGRRFNAFSDGGYLEHALPDQPSFADGRVQAYPESFWKRFQAAERTPAGLRAWLDELGVDWAIALRRSERLAGFSSFDDPKWALVHWDLTSEVWIRRERPALAAAVARFEFKHFRPYGSIVAQLGSLQRSAIAPFLAEVDRYAATSPEDPLPHLVRCGLAVRAGNALAGPLCDRAEATGSPLVLALLPRARTLAVAP